MFLTTAVWYKQAFFFIILILNCIFVVFCYVKVGGKLSVCARVMLYISGNKRMPWMMRFVLLIIYEFLDRLLESSSLTYSHMFSK